MIGRINSAAQIGRLNRVARRKEAEGDWWLAGGIDPSDCVAAYQAKDAASYVASKVNLTGDTNYDLVTSVDPDWDTSTGWKTSGNSYLETGITPPNDQTWSMIVKIKHLSHQGTNPIAGYLHNATPYEGFSISSTWAVNFGVYYSNGVGTRVLPQLTDNGEYVLAIAGSKAYRNGVDEGISLGTENGTFLSITLMAMKVDGGSVYSTKFTGELHAVALYSTVLSAGQVAALTTAMAAL